MCLKKPQNYIFTMCELKRPQKPNTCAKHSTRPGFLMKTSDCGMLVYYTLRVKLSWAILALKLTTYCELPNILVTSR